MNSRLVAWTVVLTVSVGAAGVFPPAGVAVSLLAPLLALLWAWSYGERAALFAALPAGLLLGALSPQGLPVYVASVLAGFVIARVLRAGASIGLAVAFGAVPFAVWTIG